MTAATPALRRPVLDVPLRRIYLVRAAAAVVWVVAFAASSSHLNGATMALLVLYPAIDVAASVADARTHQESGISRLQIVNAALSIVAVIAVGIASRDDTAAVLRVFGAWALLAGLIQLAVVVSRRPHVGWQWAMLLSGLGSAGAGVTLTAMAGRTHPSLHNITGYAALGAVLFIVSALLLGRTGRARPTA